MKQLVLVIGVLVSSFTAQASAQLVFDCQGQIQIDATEFESVGISISMNGNDYFSILTGTNDSSPQGTTLERLPIAVARNRLGVPQILRVARLPSAALAAIHEVKMYTVGNFEDDLSGARAAEFFDQAGTSLAKGMFVGWGGAVSCQ